jgi:hypothetical protein
MYFNVLKGAYPSLQQIDKTLDVASDETAIERGSVMVVDASGSVPVFRSATDADATDPTAYVFLCLIAQSNLVAKMAGELGGAARVTGLAVGQQLEFQTDMFEAGNYTVGQLLTCADGGVLTAHATGKNVIAQVTAAVAPKWVNNAEAVAGLRTGANIDVLTARTVWVPTLTVA